MRNTDRDVIEELRDHIDNLMHISRQHHELMYKLWQKFTRELEELKQKRNP